MLHKHEWATRTMFTKREQYVHYERDCAYGYPYEIGDPWPVEELWVWLDCVRCPKEKFIFKTRAIKEELNS